MSARGPPKIKAGRAESKNGSPPSGFITKSLVSLTAWSPASAPTRMLLRSMWLTLPFWTQTRWLRRLLLSPSGGIAVHRVCWLCSFVGSFVRSLTFWDPTFPKQLETETYFQWTTSRKWLMANQMVTWLEFKMAVCQRFVLSECFF